jgi:alkylation response protein AidB-like acyl-CoA dehydrogenase
MDFTFTEEQLALQDTLTRFVDKDYTFEQRRKNLAANRHMSQDTWAAFAELGILALPFAEEDGGLQGTPLDTYLVMRSLAKGLVLEPYISTVVLSGTFLQQHATAQQRSVLIAAIADGSARFAFAHYDVQSRYQESRIHTQAVNKAGNWVLNGHKAIVIDAPVCDHWLITARTAGQENDSHGLSVFLVKADHPGITAKSYRLHDGHLAADLVIENAELPPEALIGDADTAYPAIMQALAATNAALAAEAAGLIQALNEATLEYLKTRKQFGVAIGTFQALQHRMADMAIAAEQATSMALLAAISQAGDDPQDRIIKGAAARVLLAKLSRHVGEEAVQLHGGMGVTDELVVPHYFKRVTVLNSQYGDADFHLQRYSDSLLTLQKNQDPA